MIEDGARLLGAADLRRLNAVRPHVERTGDHVVVAADGGDDHRQIGRLVEAQHPLELIVAEAGMFHVEQSVLAAGGLEDLPHSGAVEFDHERAEFGLPRAHHRA